MVMDDREKERFRQLMRRAARFSGVNVLTYAVLDNHFHILLHLPESRPVDDRELVRRLAALYGLWFAQEVGRQLAALRQDGQDEVAERLRQPYLERMHDLSAFMKTLKQRFTQSFNQRHERKGTLWEERFRSILVEGSEGALAAIAAYIDLNAVRAGIVNDPGRYRFSGYGEALGGSREARRGLGAVIRSPGGEACWSEVHAAYRRMLYVTGRQKGVAEDGKAVRPGFSREQVQMVLDQGGELTLDQALHCRVRYFSDGLVLGSRAYVDDVLVRYRDRFSHKRQSGARPTRGIDGLDLFVARRLQLNVISLPCG